MKAAKILLIAACLLLLTACANGPAEPQTTAETTLPETTQVETDATEPETTAASAEESLPETTEEPWGRTVIRDGERWRYNSRLTTVLLLGVDTVQPEETEGNFPAQVLKKLSGKAKEDGSDEKK